MLRAFRSDRQAVTGLEYGLIAGAMALVLIAIFLRLGNTLYVLGARLSVAF